ncbi:FtsX-like permease family protein [Microbulbifer sp. VAAF005]|uniref:ABC transporter permease n=1 Tax=Microbulbifer sp. VAAF005 TaxID=3034230 RepID=UPI0024ACD335|nr:FtsX-like permease family protein [Microbulbifer sp. VAAF005]WHI47967.1 ABC transporter permease [Microbulbifer sp. VAAF005]
MRRLKVAVLNLLRNRRRSFLAVAIISIVVTALMASGGFGLFTYQSLKENAARSEGHLVLTQPGYFSSDEDFPLQLGLDNANKLRRDLLVGENVKAVQPRVYLQGLISNGDKSTIFLGQGILPSEFRVKGPFLNVTEGSILSNREDISDPEIMLGKDLARNLNVRPGDYITLMSSTVHGALNAMDFKVRGVFGTGVPDMDKRQVYISVPAAQFLLDSDRVSTMAIYGYSLDKTSSLQERLRELVPELEITTWEDRAFFYQGVKSLYDRIFGLMGIIMALVIFVSLFNTLAMSVTERTREIGTLSALGASKVELITGFILEALVLAVVGSLAGVILAGLISAGLMMFDITMPPPPGKTTGYPLTVYFSINLAWMISVAIAAICVFSSFLAARKGVNKPITEALVHV